MYHVVKMRSYFVETQRAASPTIKITIVELLESKGLAEGQAGKSTGLESLEYD